MNITTERSKILLNDMFIGICIRAGVSKSKIDFNLSSDDSYDWLEAILSDNIGLDFRYKGDKVVPILFKL